MGSAEPARFLVAGRPTTIPLAANPLADWILAIGWDEPNLPSPVLEELRNEGATDYVTMPIAFADGRRSAFTLAGERPGIFSTAELEVVRGMLAVLSCSVEVHALRRTAQPARRPTWGDPAASAS